MWRSVLSQPMRRLARGFSTVQKGTSGKKTLLSQARNNAGRRFMGYEADISTGEALVYLVLGGGGVALFGMYKTVEMRGRIEAYETGKVIPYEGPTDDEIIEFKEMIAKLNAGDDEDEDEQIPMEDDSQIIAKDPAMISKSEKDTVIFIEAPKE